MVEDALAVKPSTRAVPPVRSTSAATSVISLSPVLAGPGALPRSRCFWRS